MTDRPYCFDPKAMAEALEITEHDKEVLLIGSDHAYSCRCLICREWWRQLGPDEDGKHGPFTAEEIVEGEP